MPWSLHSHPIDELMLPLMCPPWCGTAALTKTALALEVGSLHFDAGHPAVPLEKSTSFYRETDGLSCNSFLV